MKRQGKIVPNDSEIGRIVAVDTAQVTIELSKDLKALTKVTYEDTAEVAQINSYVILPVGSQRVVAMVTRVVMTEEAELKTDKTMVTLPSARRLMKATMIGTIDKDRFNQGVSVYPVLDCPVLLANRTDLDAIFGCRKGNEAPIDPENPGFCINIGKSVVFPDYDIRINPDAFFGKHAAVIGSTGSGKSCSIATILQSVILTHGVKNTRIIILDTNGEYRNAFQECDKLTKEWIDKDSKFRVLYIPTDPSSKDDRLIIPYWLMNSDDFVRLFRAKEGIQAPVLLRALRLARAQAVGPRGLNTSLEILRTVATRIVAYTLNDNPGQQWALAMNIEDCCNDTLKYREEFPDDVKALNSLPGDGLFDEYEQAITTIKNIVSEGGSKSKELGAVKIKRIHDVIDPIAARLNQTIADCNSGTCNVTADQPLQFELLKFLEEFLNAAMREQAESGGSGRVRENCGPMILRIRRFIEDPRFDFLFDAFSDIQHSLATFIRDLLGLKSGDKPLLVNKIQKKLPYFERQKQKLTTSYNVVIVDLSLLAAEILENVTALIGRLILEFLQRAGEERTSGIQRGEFPVVLILEEAQNYIQQSRNNEDSCISREVFERIAREGRKYGLSLVVASQRPSELSKTVLSQCNSFIVHRLQNPEDLKYFREIVPGIYNQLLDQLPALAQRVALVLGECIAAPALAYMREANPVPRSKDPKFYASWVMDPTSEPNVEAICERWEGKDNNSKTVETK
jgi:uncharacterized protein